MTEQPPPAAILYHNPRCSKSRQTLALLRERGVEPTIVEYLKTPPDAEAIRALLGRLGLPARSILRAGEAAWRERGLDAAAVDDAAIIAAMAAHPILIERPILLTGKGAAVCRPPERALELL